MIGSLTGAVTSKKVTEVYKSGLKMNYIYHFISVIAYVYLIVRLTSQTRMQVCYNDPIILNGQDYCLTNKRYVRDNRLIIFESSYRQNSLAPRCWVIISWSCNWFQGFCCSQIKMIRDLSLERCKTVWSLSTVNF